MVFCGATYRMEKLYKPHTGAGRMEHAADGSAMPTGWRRYTHDLGRADRLAREGQEQGVGKGRCVLAVKRVAPHLGLKAADVLLLDTLAAFSKPQDWEQGRRPIVWPSNDYLIERTGLSRSTLKRHARHLAERGIIAFVDSPNGKRWGQRDAEGHIVEAYGFDLSPLAARVEDLEALANECAAERQLCQRIKRQTTTARRRLRAMLDLSDPDGQTGPWSIIRDRFEGFLATPLPRQPTVDELGARCAEILDLLAQTEAIIGQVQTSEKLLEQSTDCAEMDPSGAKNEPHIQTTNQQKDINCTRENPLNTTYEKPQKQISACEEEAELKLSSPKGTTNLNLVLRSCPEFTKWAKSLGGFITEWRDFVSRAAQLGPMVGITELAWKHAYAEMGGARAAAAVALIFEKVHSGEITSPTGYLRGMRRKARDGTLNLDKSFHARLRAASA